MTATCAFSNTFSDLFCPGDGGGFGGAGSSTRLQILARYPGLAIHGEVEYSQVELVTRYSTLGSWTLDVGFDGNLDSPAGTLLLPGAGIVAVANGQIIMSGPVTKPGRQRQGDDNQLTVGGTDDLQLVADRWAHQDPARADSPEADNTYVTAADTRTGPAETVIKQFVNVNAGPGAISSRQHPGFIIDIDRGLGATITGSARMQNLLEYIAKLAQQGGVGFSAVQTANGQVRFFVSQPADKTANVVFSVGLGNLSGYEYSAERPTGNLIYGGGTGTGASRLFRIASDVASIDAWGRIESFVDEGSTTTAAKLDQELRGEIAGTAARYFFSADAVETGTHQWAPLADSAAVETYDLGDRVSVVVDGQRITEVIRELHVTETSEGRTVTPIVGSAEQGGRREQRFFESVSTSIRTMRAQVRDLQRR